MKFHCFDPKERIKRSSEIRNLFKNGNKVSIDGAKLFFLLNNCKFNRIAFPLPRGYGNAVKRNHSRRFSREVFRNIKPNLNIGYDMLFLVYPIQEKDSFYLRYKQFKMLCKKANIIID